MNMPTTPNDPPTLEAYNQLWKEGYRVTGFGIEAMEVSMPCPFCAWPGLLTYHLPEVRQVMSAPHKCEHCGRTARHAITDSPDGSETRFELLVVDGPDVPDYLPPFRRAVPMDLSKQAIGE
jgi:hypothetical protein